MLTPTELCNTMNEVYETLKTMTVDQIEAAAVLADSKMPPSEAAIYKHQCHYALVKKESGAWP